MGRVLISHCVGRYTDKVPHFRAVSGVPNRGHARPLCAFGRFSGPTASGAPAAKPTCLDRSHAACHSSPISLALISKQHSSDQSNPLACVHALRCVSRTATHDKGTLSHSEKSLLSLNHTKSTARTSFHSGLRAFGDILKSLHSISPHSITRPRSHTLP